MAEESRIYIQNMTDTHTGLQPFSFILILFSWCHSKEKGVDIKKLNLPGVQSEREKKDLHIFTLNLPSKFGDH
jgi:hypothetical protein